MSLPKLVATDLDGTLVRADGTVSDYTRGVLEALDERGVPVVFVTGRPLRWTEPVFQHVGSHGLAVVSNGALVWDVARDAMHLQRPIAPSVGLEVVEAVRAAVPGSMFAVEALDGLGLEDGYLSRNRVPDDARRAPIADLLVAPALKLLARHEELEPLDYWRRAEAAVEGAVTITWSSATTLLEMSAAGVTKASTLELVARGLGCEAADVIAFGDMPNDLPMLTWAGTSYAMGNAHPSVIDAADGMAPDHEEDGVARTLAWVFDL